MINVKVYSFYRFVEIKNKIKIKNEIESFISNQKLRGTILIANEGINASISGKEVDLNLLLNFIKQLLKIRKIEIKINNVSYLPFNRIKIRLKKEIVSLGKGKIIKKSAKSNFIKPSEWDDLIIQKDILLIDLRNIYEIEIGRFKNSINPLTNNFREFPKRFKEMKFKKDKKIAMYCTGGIRCEKASDYLSQEGYKNIFQLKGGIINYLDYAKKNGKHTNWKGECFVFDNRVTINKMLMPGKYIQCHGCRTPITKKEAMSEMYIKGVSCPHCFSKRSEKQKKSSISRQKQINLAEIKNIQHPFSRITKL